MPKGMQIFTTGNPNLVRHVDAEVGDSGPGEVRTIRRAIFDVWYSVITLASDT